MNPAVLLVAETSLQYYCVIIKKSMDMMVVEDMQ